MLNNNQRRSQIYDHYSLSGINESVFISITGGLTEIINHYILAYKENTLYWGVGNK